MKKNKSKAIDINAGYASGTDLTVNEKEILDDISRRTGFVYQKNIWRSKYWGKNLGASHWLGIYEDKKAVLKIQGAKTDTTEVEMIKEFSKQNRSKLIRPPSIYKSLTWDDQKGYEAVIADYISGGQVLEDGKLVFREEVTEFLSYYKEYRENCIPKNPWLPKPTNDDNWQSLLDKLISTSTKAYPDSPLRKKEDIEIASRAYQILSKVYKNVPLEFMHGHFSCKDLLFESEGSKKVALFSNLFWKWRYPFFDAVFAYHWFIYELAHVKNINENVVDEQRKIWLDEIYNVTGANSSIEKKELLNAALLERAVAGFMLDSFLCDPKKTISKYLNESSKNEAIRLMTLFN